MTGKPKYSGTIGVVVRDPGQQLYHEIKQGKALGRRMFMKTPPMTVFRLVENSNSIDSRMGAEHTPQARGIYRSAESARNYVVQHVKGIQVPPLNQWFKHSTGVMSWGDGWWDIVPDQVIMD